MTSTSPEKLKGAKVTAKEIDMALRLIEDMADKWQPGKYKDTYHRISSRASRRRSRQARPRRSPSPRRTRRPRRART